MIKIRALRSSQLDAYKKLILKALLEDEDCFRIAPIDEETEGFPTTEEEDSFTIGAFDEEELIGVASFKRGGANRVKLQHKGILFKIYVDSGYRKQGIAKQLIQEVIKRVALIKNIEQINLTVIPTNKHAKLLYEKFGFKTFASEEKAVKWKGQYFNEDQMKLILKRGE